MNFYKTLSQYYDIIFPSNPIQISFIKKYLKEHSSILDMAAGTGNIALELARLKHQVTAIDLDPEMVEKIKLKCDRELTNLEAKILDMRAITQFEPTSFDTVICIGNSIVHLDSLDEIVSVVEAVYRNLKDNGTFIVQVVNYDRILEKNITSLPVIERQEEGITFIRTYEHENQKIIFNGELIVNRNGNETREVYKNSVELYPLTSDQIHKVLSESGFSKIELFGDFKEAPFNLTSPALIAVAQK
jgi:2-polyprenyl-3-methyl-5-hydroxy-6-metoxy-1,4-benzoquinol methylase